MESQLKLAAKFYRCRDACRMLYGREYKKAIAPYQELIQAAMKKHHLDSETEAAIRLVNIALKERGSAPTVMVILAACVEMVEGE